MPIESPVATETTLPAPEASAFPDFDAAFPDGLDSPPPAPEKKPAPEPATTSGSEDRSSTTPQSGAGTTPKPADKPADKPEEKAPETPATPEDEFTPPTVAKNSELRGFAFRMGNKAKEYKSQLTQLQQRITQLEAQPPKQQVDNSAMAAQLAEANKRLEQYENDLRLTKYDRSAEYRDKYERPYKDAIARAYREVKELIAFEPNAEDPENPKERTANQQDFDEVYGLPLGQATRLAKQRFGDAAMIVLQHRQKIRELMESAYQAVEEYKGKGAEAEKFTKAQEAQREQGMVSMFSAARGMHAKRNPALFAEKEGDTEGNSLLTKGRQFADMVFAGNDGLTPQQVVMRDARAYNWLSAFPRVSSALEKAKAEIAELKSTLESIKGSAPGKPKPSAESAPPSEKGWESDFDAKIT